MCEDYSIAYLADTHQHSVPCKVCESCTTLVSAQYHVMQESASLVAQEVS